MKSKESDLSHRELLKALIYDKDSGSFTWRIDRPVYHFKNLHGYNLFMSRYAGNQAGSIVKDKSGIKYRNIRINNVAYKEHRLALFYVNGVWPNIVDHNDGDGLNNKFNNLTSGCLVLNSKNRSKSKSNSSGVNGVHWSKCSSKWQATASYTDMNGISKRVHIGLFSNIEDAKTARLKWNIENNYTERHGS